MQWLSSWKTTIAGVVVLGLGVYLLTKGEAVQGGAMITVGLGLLAAKDAAQ